MSRKWGGGAGKKKQIEVHPALNPELSTLKPRVGQNIALHVLPTAKNSFLQDPAPIPIFYNVHPNNTLVADWALSPFLIGQMFVREPSWKYSAKLVGS